MRDFLRGEFKRRLFSSDWRVFADAILLSLRCPWIMICFWQFRVKMARTLGSSNSGFFFLGFGCWCEGVNFSVPFFFCKDSTLLSILLNRYWLIVCSSLVLLTTQVSVYLWLSYVRPFCVFLFVSFVFCFVILSTLGFCPILAPSVFFFYVLQPAVCFVFVSGSSLSWLVCHFHCVCYRLLFIPLPVVHFGSSFI